MRQLRETTVEDGCKRCLYPWIIGTFAILVFPWTILSAGVFREKARPDRIAIGIVSGTAATITLGYLLAMAGKLDKHEAALEQCRQILKIDPNNTKTYALMGEIFTADGERRRAVATYREILKRDPDNKSPGSS